MTLENFARPRVPLILDRHRHRDGPNRRMMRLHRLVEALQSDNGLVRYLLSLRLR